MGSNSPITPVENGRTCSGSILSSLATISQDLKLRSKPFFPVPALALPLLIRSASTLDFKWFFATKTGAAQKIFLVKTAAVLEPLIREIRDKSNELLPLIPDDIEED